MSEDSGQGMTEYALILSFVALAVVAAVRLLGQAISDFLPTVLDDVD
ncbi:MAG: Flp family type IVb pilin [Tindallia sp. MSAO_Bac2]|nr:MAG: Flp family type IVb pilin [Tindallia sp. MSAO_Bac2]